MLKIKNQKGSALIYLLIIISLFSILSVAGGSSYLSVAETTNRDLARIEGNNLSDTITQVYQDPVNCAPFLLTQPAPSLGSEFSAMIADGTHKTPANFKILLPQVGLAAPSAIAAPGLSVGTLTIASVTIASLTSINPATHSYLATIRVNFAPSQTHFVEPPAVIPFYIVADAANNPQSCFASAFDNSTQTIQDLVCTNQKYPDNTFDPNGGATPCLKK